MQDDNAIAEMLKNHPTPAPDDGFFERALLRAENHGLKQQRSRWVMTGFASAVAAGLVLWVLGSQLLLPVTPAEHVGIPAVVMTLEEPRTVNLVFAAKEALPNALLTVELPSGVELAGFPGQRQISWSTSLNEGRNLLPLTLVATDAVEGIVLATLQHDDRNRTFRLRVAIG